MAEIRIAIIGTAGRRDDGPRLFAELYRKMCADALTRIDAILATSPRDNIVLVSGGAAWADHIAVRLYLQGEAHSLRLYLPAELRNGRFAERPGDRFDPGRIANHYHRLFREKTEIDGLKEIETAILKEATANTSHRGFRERDTALAQDADYVLAYTFGPGAAYSGAGPGIEYPPDHPGFRSPDAAGLKHGSGTADTWEKALRAISKTHIDLSTLAVQPRILEFQGPNRFLSNFWPAPVILDGVTYPTVEHAYQAAKTSPDTRGPFLAAPSPGAAKRLGRSVPLRPGWDTIKLEVMQDLLRQKFADPVLAGELLETGTAQLVEGNSWGDTFWGQSPPGEGSNHLGRLLMQIRASLTQSRHRPGKEPELCLRLSTRETHTAAPARRAPEVEATMYFAYGGNRRPGVGSATTFDAILAGERTSTTRFERWPNYERWRSLQPGAVLRFWSENKVGQGRAVDVIVEAVREIDLAGIDAPALEAWSKREGWSSDAGRRFGEKYGRGIQILFKDPKLPDNNALMPGLGGDLHPPDLRADYRPGIDITAVDAQVLVNTVNRVKVMGKGVALAFKTRWPQIMPAYAKACDDGHIRPGGVHPIELPGGRTMVCLCTKDHWRDPSQYEWALEGLYNLRRYLEDTGKTTCALPPPGCGSGGLDWSRVHAMTQAAFDGWRGRLIITAERPAPDLPAYRDAKENLDNLAHYFAVTPKPRPTVAQERLPEDGIPAKNLPEQNSSALILLRRMMAQSHARER